MSVFKISDKSVRNELEYHLSLMGAFLEPRFSGDVVELRVDQMFIVVCLAYGEDPNRYVEYLQSCVGNEELKTKLISSLYRILQKKDP